MMKPGSIYSAVIKKISAGERLYWILLDPDDFSDTKAAAIACEAENCGAHGLLIGGSLLHTTQLDSFVAAIKKAVSIPVILFPGDATQISRHADAILFLSLISGRNPVNLIGE